MKNTQPISATAIICLGVKHVAIGTEKCQQSRPGTAMFSPIQNISR